MRLVNAMFLAIHLSVRKKAIKVKLAKKLSLDVFRMLKYIQLSTAFKKLTFCNMVSWSTALNLAFLYFHYGSVQKIRPKFLKTWIFHFFV